MDTVWLGLEALRRWWAGAGTYLLVEMVLPGGTLLALLLYLYRRRQYARERVMWAVSNQWRFSVPSRIDVPGGGTDWVTSDRNLSRTDR